MTDAIESFVLNPRQNKFQEITTSTIKERLSFKNEVSFTKPHILKFFAFVLVIEGEYEHALDFKKYKIKAGDLFIICPNQIHYFIDLEGFDGYIITFSESFLRDYFLDFNPMIRYELLYEFYMHKQLKLSTYTINQFIMIYHLIQQELKHKFDSSQKIILQNLLSVLLHNINREHVSTDLVSKMKIDNVFIDFMQELTKEASYKLNVTHYANKLGISVKTLQSVVKKNMNKSPKQMIDDNLILECKRQLLNTECLIQDIAFNLGFEDPSAFTKYFKKITSQTPAQFRLKSINKVGFACFNQ